MNLNNIATKFGRGGIILRGNEPLTNDKIIQYAPSVFAEGKHESRSERYTYLSTADMLDAMRAEGFYPYEVRQGGTRIEGKAEYTKHMIRFRHEGTIAKAVGDVFKEVVLVNSHDGTSSYQLMSGLFRLACLNGLVVSKGDSNVIKIAHKGNIEREVIEGAYTIIHDSDRITNKVQEWEGLELTQSQQIAFARSAGIARWGKDDSGKDLTPITPSQILTTHRAGDNKPDLWTTYNVVQENLINGGIRYNSIDHHGQRTGMKRTKPVQAVKPNINLNQALWELASEMQKLLS